MQNELEFILYRAKEANVNIRTWS